MLYHRIFNQTSAKLLSEHWTRKLEITNQNLPVVHNLHDNEMRKLNKKTIERN